MENIIYRDAMFVERSKEDDTYVFQISDETKDSHGTVFLSSGWDFARFRSNPIVLYQHNGGSTDPDDILGRATDIWQKDGKTFSRVSLESSDTNPKAGKVRNKIENGTLRMASVGAIVHDYRRGLKENGEDKEAIYFTRQELIEWSIVSAGSNKNALLQRSEESLEAMRKVAFKDEVEEKQNEKTFSRDMKYRKLLINKNKAK